MIAAKNAPLSAAGGDLGLGDELQNQVTAEIMERRKKSMLAANQSSAAYGALGLGVNTSPGTGNTGGSTGGAYGSLLSPGGLGA